jgi:L-amino acid N-acyltransferase YncA
MKPPVRALKSTAVRAMRDDDWPSVLAIYSEGIATGRRNVRDRGADVRALVGAPSGRAPFRRDAWAACDRLGRLHGRWRDVLLLERRTSAARA